MLSVLMLSVAIVNAECRYPECRCAECRGALWVRITTHNFRRNFWMSLIS
jgi:hypothetical protein